MLRLPAGDERDRNEIKLLAQLAPLLLATGGIGDTAGSAAVTRMRELAGRIGRQTLYFSTLSTLTSVVWRLRGQIDVAEVTGREALAIAREIGDPVLELIAHQLVGGNRFHLGDFATARPHLEERLSHRQRARRTRNVMAVLSLTSRAYGHLGGLFWLTGRTDAARRSAESSLVEAARTDISAVSSMAHVLAAWTFILSRDVERVLDLVNADAITASEPALPLWTSTAAVSAPAGHGVQQGRKDHGLAEVESGYRAYLANQGEASAFDYQVLRAESLLRVGRLDDAEEMSEEALENLRQTGKSYLASELYRIRGEILWARNGERAAEESDPLLA